jgi:hypothetical protein
MEIVQVLMQLKQGKMRVVFISLLVMQIRQLLVTTQP